MKLAEILKEHSPLELELGLSIEPNTPFTVCRSFKAGNIMDEAEAIAQTWLNLPREMLNSHCEVVLLSQAKPLSDEKPKNGLYPPFTGLISENFIDILVTLTIAKDATPLKGFLEIWGDDWYEKDGIWMLSRSPLIDKARLMAHARSLYK